FKTRQPCQRIGTAWNHGTEYEGVLLHAVENEARERPKFPAAKLTYHLRSCLEKVPCVLWRGFDGFQCVVQFSGGNAPSVPPRLPGSRPQTSARPWQNPGGRGPSSHRGTKLFLRQTRRAAGGDVLDPANPRSHYFAQRGGGDDTLNQATGQFQPVFGGQVQRTFGNICRHHEHKITDAFGRRKGGLWKSSKQQVAVPR